MTFAEQQNVGTYRSAATTTAGWAGNAHPAGISAPRLTGRRRLEWAVLGVVAAVLAFLSAELRAEEAIVPQTLQDDDSVALEGDLLPGLAAGDAVLSADDLEAERARAMLEVDRITINDQDLNGVVSNNSAIDTISGNNTIAGDAFGNATGFIGTIQNTGNNVLIQSATIVNIAVEP